MEAKSCPEPFLLDCPYCRSIDSRSVLRDPLVVRCLNCGLYRPRERMDQSAQRGYLAGVNQDLKLENFPSPLAGAIRCQWEIELLRRFCPTAFQKGRALDVGCAEGSFVADLQEAGVSATGLEPLAGLVHFGQHAGLDIHRGYFDLDGLAGLENERFDLITMRESIYYLADLRQSLVLIKKLLHPQGWLYIKAHQPQSCWYWRYPDRLRRFGRYVQGMLPPTALRNILQHENFDIQYFSYFRMQILPKFVLASRVLLPVNLAVSALAHPVLHWLAAGDRFAMIACKLKKEEKN